MSEPEDQEDEPHRLGIQSVETAAEILKALAQGGGVLSLTKLASQANMHVAKVHRYLISLTRCGLVTQEREGGNYQIGPLAVTLGLTGLRISNPVRTAFDALPGLRDQVNETVCLAIWGDLGPTVIALEESSHPVTMNVRIGSILSVATTAIGRTFAAYLPAAVIAPFLERERAAHRPGRASPALPAARELDEILKKIRARGLSRVQGTAIPGVNALATPVFDHRGQVIFVLGVVGRQETLDTDWEALPAQALKAAAAALSRAFGHVDVAPAPKLERASTKRA